MTVELSDPSMADDLVTFLHKALWCIAERNGHGTIEVSLPGSPSEEEARRMLESQLARWQASHPGVKARRKPLYDL